MSKPLLSVVITVYNEEDNIQPLLEATYAALSEIDYEVILIEDGSTDRTVAEVKKYANERTKLLIFNRNYGQTTALAAGIDQATGEYIATMDGDLQNDPTDLPLMLRKAMDEEWDVVAGRRANRKDGFVLRKIPSKIANWIIRNTTKVYLNDYGCTLRVYKAEIAQNMGLYGELHRFIPVLAKQAPSKNTRHLKVRPQPNLQGDGRFDPDAFFPKVFSETDSSLWRLGFTLFPVGFIDQFLPIDFKTTRRRYLGQTDHDFGFYTHFRRNPIDHDGDHRRDHRAHVLRVTG